MLCKDLSNFTIKSITFFFYKKERLSTPKSLLSREWLPVSHFELDFMYNHPTDVLKRSVKILYLHSDKTIFIKIRIKMNTSLPF